MRHHALQQGMGMNRKLGGLRKAMLYCLLLPGLVLMLAGSLILPRTFQTHIRIFGLSGEQVILIGAAMLLAGVVIARVTRKSSRPD